MCVIQSILGQSLRRHKRSGGTALGLVLAAATMASAAFADTANAPSTIGTPMGAGDVYRMIKSGIARVTVSYPVKGGSMRSTGTGFLVDGDGDFATNCHVVEAPDATGPVTVALDFADDGTRMAAKVLGCDGPGDIAVVHVDGDVSQRRPLHFAKSGTFEPGDDVIAVGYGFDLYGEPTVTRGIISALHRSLGDHGDLVQTDAAINHGNSGGPLLNLRGEVVGVNSYSLGATMDLSALLSAQEDMLKKGDASTTVPVNDVRNLDFARSAVTVAAYVQKIIANGEVRRFDLGVTVASIDPTKYYLPRQGVVVESVVPGSQAERIGLKTGDIIYSIELGDGTTWLTPDAAAFEDALALLTPGPSTKVHEYELTDNGIAQAKAQLPVSASDIVWYHADFTPVAPAQKSTSR